MMNKFNFMLFIMYLLLANDQELVPNYYKQRNHQKHNNQTPKTLPVIKINTHIILINKFIVSSSFTEQLDESKLKLKFAPYFTSKLPLI